MALVMRTALTTVERLLQRSLRYAYQIRHPAVADVAALRAVVTRGESSTPQIIDGAPMRYVTSRGKCFDWSATSSTADNGTTVIRPTDVDASKPGRWLETTSTIQSGYLNSVILWNGEFSRDEFEQRIYSQKPCVAIIWEGSKNEQRSTVAGAIYDYPCSFSILCVSSSLRADQGALYGPGLSAESAVDPGAIAILGDVKKLLADGHKTAETTGVLGETGIKQIVLGEEGIEDINLQEREAIISLAVDVLCSVENGDDAATEHETLDDIAAQSRFTNLHGVAEFDPENYVVSGYAFLPGIGLTKTPSAGSAYLGGVLVSSSPAARTFGARTDTYRDLKADGTFRYTEVGNGLDVDDPADGELRVGVTVTDAVQVVSDTYLAPTSDDVGDETIIPTP